MRKKIKRGQKVRVSFSPRARVLVLEHTFTGPELTTALRRAQLESGKYVVRYTLDDLDELLSFVAAEANRNPRIAPGRGTPAGPVLLPSERCGRPQPSETRG